MSAKARFNHTLKKAKEQGRFERSERQKLNNLFGIMANVQKDLFKNEQKLFKALFSNPFVLFDVQGNRNVKRLVNSHYIGNFGHIGINKQ